MTAAKSSRKETRHPEIVRCEQQLRMWKSERDRLQRLLDDEQFHAKRQDLLDKIERVRRDLAELDEHRANAPTRLTKIEQRIDKLEDLVVVMQQHPEVIPAIAAQRRILEIINRGEDPLDRKKT